MHFISVILIHFVPYILILSKHLYETYFCQPHGISPDLYLSVHVTSWPRGLARPSQAPAQVREQGAAEPWSPAERNGSSSIRMCGRPAASARRDPVWQGEVRDSWEAAGEADLHPCSLQAPSDLQRAQWDTESQWPETEAHKSRETTCTPARST